MGADVIQEFGFCWSTTNKIPTLNDNKKNVLSTPALGEFYAFVPFVSSNTYYLRTYAIVNGIVTYGNIQYNTF